MTLLFKPKLNYGQASYTRSLKCTHQQTSNDLMIL